MPSFLHRDTNQYFPATGLFEYNGSKCRIMETNKFDEYTQVNTLTWRLERNDQLLKDEYYFRMKMFCSHEMNILLDNSGLVIKNKIFKYLEPS